MKEVRFFYTPDAATSHELPADEAMHALRVLRLQFGDEMMLMDGCGHFFRAEISQVKNTIIALMRKPRQSTITLKRLLRPSMW